MATPPSIIKYAPYRVLIRSADDKYTLFLAIPHFEGQTVVEKSRTFDLAINKEYLSFQIEGQPTSEAVRFERRKIRLRSVFPDLLPWEGEEEEEDEEDQIMPEFHRSPENSLEISMNLASSPRIIRKYSVDLEDCTMLGAAPLADVIYNIPYAFMYRAKGPSRTFILKTLAFLDGYRFEPHFGEIRMIRGGRNLNTTIVLVKDEGYKDLFIHQALVNQYDSGIQGMYGLQVQFADTAKKLTFANRLTIHARLEVKSKTVNADELL